MKKKRKWVKVVIVVVVALILLVPIRYAPKDGGTKEYKALLNLANQPRYY